MHPRRSGHQGVQSKETRREASPIVLHRSVHAVHAVVVPVRRLSVVAAVRVLVVCQLLVVVVVVGEFLHRNE